MTAPQLTGVAGFLARYHGLRDRLPGSGAARDAAAESFRNLGFPGRRDEAWKYTNLRPLAEAAFHEPLSVVQDSSSLLSALRITETRLVFLDGRFRADLSDAVPAAFGCFADHPEFGTLAQPGRDPMAALNTMLAEDGARLTIAPDTDAGTIQLAAISSGGAALPTASHPHHIIHLGRNARLTLIETAAGQGAYLHNPVTEITLDEGAELQHIRLQQEDAAAFHLATIYANTAAGATYDCFTLTLGGRLVRTEFHTNLNGSNGTTHLSAAQLLRGSQHADFTSVVRHVAPHCASRQTVKNVLAGRSRGVFQGRIEVAREAQKTDGYQMSQALLLSPDAEIDTKPELEIFADDVKCSHGATVGELDANQMFYLRSRGVPQPEARAILIRAFLQEALDAVRHEPARAALESAVDAWWRSEAA